MTSCNHQVTRNIAQCNIPCSGQKRCVTSCRNRCGKWTCSTFCDDFKQLSVSLRSHTSPLPSVNACAIFRATCLAMRLHSMTAHLLSTCPFVADRLSIVVTQLFQEDLEKQQQQVNSLTHMVVVVDESSTESATADLEEQLAVLGERWSNVCKWTEQR